MYQFCPFVMDGQYVFRRIFNLMRQVHELEEYNTLFCHNYRVQSKYALNFCHTHHEQMLVVKVLGTPVGGGQRGPYGP